MKKAQPEFLLQIAVCDYLRRKYPSVLFDSDAAGFLKMTIPQGARAKRVRKEEFKRPDLAVYEARHGFNGLFIELKASNPFKKNGEIKSDGKGHLEGQQASLDDLKQRGYYATFGWDFDTITKLIDWYLK